MRIGTVWPDRATRGRGGCRVRMLAVSESPSSMRRCVAPVQPAVDALQPVVVQVGAPEWIEILTREKEPLAPGPRPPMLDRADSDRHDSERDSKRPECGARRHGYRRVCGGIEPMRRECSGERGRRRHREHRGGKQSGMTARVYGGGRSRCVLRTGFACPGSRSTLDAEDRDQGTKSDGGEQEREGHGQQRTVVLEHVGQHETRDSGADEREGPRGKRRTVCRQASVGPSSAVHRHVVRWIRFAPALAREDHRHLLGCRLDGRPDRLQRNEISR